MALYELSKTAITEIGQTSFSTQGIGERSDLQRLLKQNISVIAPEPLLVIAEEFSEWDESKRRIDLLALDEAANLVVIELKRTDDGGHMELQAIRYAAMVSAMTFKKAVEVFEEYLERNDRTEDANATILDFLKWDDVKEGFGQDVRVILVSAEFSKEITTSVLWLNSRGLDICCVRLRPYVLDSRLLLDVQQIIPLPEAASYTVQIKKKAEENRSSRIQERDFSKYDLQIDGLLKPHLNKRNLVFEVVKAAVLKGISAEQIAAMLQPNKWICVDGEANATEFAERASKLMTKLGTAYDLGRYFCDDGELFHLSGKTYALSRMWSIKSLPIVNELISKLPEGTVRYAPSEEASV